MNENEQNIIQFSEGINKVFIDSKTGQNEILTESDKYRILGEFNDTEKEYPKNSTIHQLFEKQVKTSPDNIAVVFGDEKLTYKQLNEKSNQLARILRKKGVKHDSIVAIMVECSLEMIVGVLGILKAGGAYLPIDPEYPLDRISFMLKDSGAEILLTQSVINNKDVIVLNLDYDSSYDDDSSDLVTVSTTKSLAYIIYTSGSTGKPKGVMIEHSALINMCFWYKDYFNINELDRSTKYAGFGFDASVWEIFPQIIVGASIYIIKKEIKFDMDMLNEYFEENKVTISFLPTQVCERFMSIDNKSLRYLSTGGDKLKKYIHTRYKIINNYGPTENTVVSTNFVVDREYNNIPIGKPISNTKIYIVDKNSELCTIGMAGELCVSGAGLARGYLNRPELTREKFVPNPYLTEGDVLSNNIGFERMYRTGDLARWLPDGNIEFLGRIDNQVKIRGYRIELGEIEDKLLHHIKIKEAVVIVKEDSSSNKYLCGCIVQEGQGELTTTELREYLANELPDYMIPSSFIQIDTLPLTPNGKVDRVSLVNDNKYSELEGNMITGVEYVAPINEEQEKLASIWREVLGVSRIGINDNFFMHGGDSIKAIQVCSRLQKCNMKLEVTKLLTNPTIKEVCKYVVYNTISEENDMVIKNQVEEMEDFEAIKEILSKNGIGQNQIQDLYALSPMQEGMLFHSIFEKNCDENNSNSYLVQTILDIDGEINIEMFEESFNEIIDKYHVLKTVFVYGKIKKPLQVVLKKREYKLEYIDTTEMKHIDKNEYIEKFKTIDKENGFDLTKDIPMRVSILKIEKLKYLLIWSFHHIIIDGWCMSLIMKDLFRNYQSKKEGIKIELEVPEPYSKYINWLEKQDKEVAIIYWKEYLHKYEQKALLPSTKATNNRKINRSTQKSIVIEQKTYTRLVRFCKRLGVTLNTVMLTAWGLILQKYNNTDDVVFGAVVSGRPVEITGIEQMVGLFINTIPTRFRTNGEESIEEAMKALQHKVIESKPYEYISLAEIQSNSEIKHNMIDTIMAFENYPIDEKLYNNTQKTSRGFTIKSVDTFVQTNYGFNIMIEPREELLIKISYNEEIYEEVQIDRVLGHIIRAIATIISKPEMKIKEIDIVTEEEKQQILTEFNNTEVEYPKNKTIQQLFEEQVEKTPDNIAVMMDGECLTYKQLNEKTNQLARVLRTNGVKSNSIVGLILDRSLEMIIGIMGVLKAGGACLPIDASYPQDRIAHMLEDCDVKILLTQLHLKNIVKFHGEIIHLDNTELYNGIATNLDYINTADNPAYVIYTSGSTGMPKGNLTTHYNISRVVKNTNYIQVTQNDTLLQLSNYAFDGSIFDIYAALLNGAKLVIVSKEKLLDIEKLGNLIEDEGITVFFVTTALFNVLVDMKINKLKNVRKILFGGERVSLQHAQKALNILGTDKILHVYGPTESTVFTTCYPVDSISEVFGTVPIGKPIANTEVYIVDKYNNLCPIGIAGELCISGDGLAKGYLNRPELTSKKFVDNPFVLGSRMYRTGDLARWLPDGNLEFLDRIDQQVKIRGFRIELGEIENKLLEYRDIKDAVVIAKEDNDCSKYLCAYIITNEEKELEIVELKEYLKEQLPAYMIPSYFVKLENLPLTNNGKINTKALPEPDISEMEEVEYEVPRNKTEEKLVDIWMEVLGVDKIGINNNFFDLGGHSLKATVIVAKIHRELNIEISLRVIFSSPTIKLLAKHIESLNKSKYFSIEVVGCEGSYWASSAQKRIYALQQLDANSTNYNIPGIFEIEGNLDVQRLKEAFDKLVCRHESLRTSFELGEEGLIQKVHKKVEFIIESADSLLTKNSLIEVDDVAKVFVRAFDLRKPPLFRLGIIKVKSERHIFMLDIHHIISDGISVGIIIEELSKAYEGKVLDELRIQYKDFSAWQNNFINSGRLQEQEIYWLDKFSQDIPVLNLPKDYQRPLIQSFEGAGVSFEVDKHLTAKLKSIAKETDTTLYMILLGVYTVVLSKYSGQEDVIVGTPTAGRQHAELQNIVGMFVNTLPMRIYPKSNKTFREFLKEVKETALEAYENQDYQFEELVNKLNIVRDFSKNPIFDVMFALQNIEEKQLEIQGLNITPYQVNSIISKFDMTLIAVEALENINFNLEYCTKIFKRETIERIGIHLKNIINIVVENIDIRLEEIEIMSEEESRQILIDFNNTKVEYPLEKTIQQLFEEQVERAPDNIAVVFGKNQLTYKELNTKANQLARALRRSGIQPDSIIGIMVEGSLDMIVGILGILKAGCAYLPIDPQYPLDRIEYILKDSGTKILLTQSSIYNNETITILNLDDDSVYYEDSSNLDSINTPTSLAYIIYTSGSTGNPKGVMIEHSSLINMCFWYKNYYNISEADRSTKYAGVGFDASVWEIFPALIAGASIYIIKKEIKLDIDKLNEYYEENKITISFLPTQVCENFMLKDNKSLRYLLTGGDKLKKCSHAGYKIINNYGPTENTVVTTSFVLDKEYNNIPIGAPIANTKIYIVDKYNKLCAIGVAGELCVSGAGLARGYLNRPELTAEKFVPNPYEICGQAGLARMYRTGDLARWLQDGNIEFLGRIDHQVKIRGYRIELGEIESKLLEYSEIKEVVVLAKQDNNNENYLCAYIVSHIDFTIEKLHAYLLEKLPNYMIPQSFIQLDIMPLTANGKVDTKKLLSLEELVELEQEHIEPRNEIEEFLVEVVSRVLSIHKIGVRDNLFYKGANSINIMIIARNIKDKYEIEYNYIFKHPYIEKIAKQVKPKEYDMKTTIRKIKDDYRNSSNIPINIDVQNYKEDSYKTYIDRVIREYSEIDLSKTTNYKNILLAGGTGYLGLYLLKDILENTDSKITLIIRGNSLEESQYRLIEGIGFYFGEEIYNKYKNRICIHNGDLSKDMFGLDRQQYSGLIDNIDCIINSAANVKHFGLYEEFYKANVVVTQNLLNLCNEGAGKDYNHISTISVGTGNIENKQVQFFSEYECDVNQKLDNYYVKTKLMAEKLVIEARSKGIRTTIFRAGNLVFNSMTGKCQKNIEDNAFYKIVKSLIKFRCFPNENIKNVELTFVDRASNAIVLLFNKDALANETFHINNSNVISYKEFVEWTNEKLFKLGLIGMEDFLDYLAENYDNYSLREHISTFLVHTGLEDCIVKTKETEFVYASDKTQNILAKLGFNWDAVSKEHIRNMVEYGLEIGFFE